MHGSADSEGQGAVAKSAQALDKCLVLNTALL